MFVTVDKTAKYKAKLPKEIRKSNNKKQEDKVTNSAHL